MKGVKERTQAHDQWSRKPQDNFFHDEDFSFLISAGKAVGKHTGILYPLESGHAPIIEKIYPLSI
jgi:hypothetical protein